MTRGWQNRSTKTASSAKDNKKIKMPNKTMTQEPITDREQILEQLRAVEAGDELTIETESGYRDNREVTNSPIGTFDFGDPIQQGRVVNTDRGTMHRLTDNPDNPLSTGMKITKLWVWTD